MISLKAFYSKRFLVGFFAGICFIFYFGEVSISKSFFKRVDRCKNLEDKIQNMERHSNKKIEGVLKFVVISGSRG